jgi:hypothetical protein
VINLIVPDSKTEISNFCSEAGIQRYLSGQNRKADRPIAVKDDLNSNGTIERRQSLKAPVSMILTDAGMQIEQSDWHPPKAWNAICTK